MVSQPNRFAAAALVVVAIAFIAVMTLRPASGPPTPLPFVCIFCGSLGGVDFLLNTILFAPLGLSLYLLLRSGRTTIMMGIAFTLAIEAMQWRFIPGRDASLGDLVANSLGTAVGVMIAQVGVTGLHATGRLARMLAVMFAALAAAVVVASGWLLQPVRVRYPLSVQWKAPRPNMDTFRGDLQLATVNGERIFPVQWVNPGQFFDTDSRSVSLNVRIGGRVEPSVRQSIIVRLASHWEEGLYLGQWKDAVVFRTHQVAEKARFRPLLVGLNGAFQSTVDGESRTMAARSNPRAMTLDAGRDGTSSQVTVRRTSGLGWTLILPWDVAVTPRWWVANAAWLGALFLPVGFFAARSGRHHGGAGILHWWPLLVTLGALLATPRVFGLGYPGVADWAGVATGIFLGSALEKMIPTRMPAPLNPAAVSRTITS